MRNILFYIVITISLGFSGLAGAMSLIGGAEDGIIAGQPVTHTARNNKVPSGEIMAKWPSAAIIAGFSVLGVVAVSRRYGGGRRP